MPTPRRKGGSVIYWLTRLEGAQTLIEEEKHNGGIRRLICSPPYRLYPKIPQNTFHRLLELGYVAPLRVGNTEIDRMIAACKYKQFTITKQGRAALAEAAARGNIKDELKETRPAA